MAGYIILISDEKNFEECARYGIYSTNLHITKVAKNGLWSQPKEGTFADYFTMRPGDHVYFFFQRKLYGIGELSAIPCGDSEDCKFLSYLNADDPHIPTEEEYTAANPLVPYLTTDNRCFCVFHPHPQMFRQGVDMDEVLNSHPTAFRMLRVMYQVSFIKIDDEEDAALYDIILRRNESALPDTSGSITFDDSIQKQLGKTDLTPYRFHHCRMAQKSINAKTGKTRHEMILEASLCDLLTHKDIPPFGHLDYVSHQVGASPAKPVVYIDRMDVFGYRYIPGFRTISKYVIIELKAGDASTDVVGQVMKYVDFVTKEYAHGNYGMVEAYIVAFDFSAQISELCQSIGVRNYMDELRPPKPATWNALHLVRYRWTADGFSFEEVCDSE